MSRAAVVGVLALGLAACARGATTEQVTTAQRQTTTTSGQSGGGSSQAPAKDTFNGHVLRGTGRYAGRHGAVTIYLHPGSSAAASPRATFTLSAKRCSGSHRCLRLSGTLHGRLTRTPTHPDIGAHYTITAHGSADPLGKVSGSGTVAGTGFIYHSHEQLQLTLKGPHGTVTIHAFSPPVPGFTSP